jgi:threonine synthase
MSRDDGVTTAEPGGEAGFSPQSLMDGGDYQAKRVEEISKAGAEIVRVEGDYKHAVEASRKRVADDDLYDANNGGANLALQLRAYREIAREIYDELRGAPAVVAVPVSNGTTLAGLYKGFLSL